MKEKEENMDKSILWSSLGGLVCTVWLVRHHHTPTFFSLGRHQINNCGGGQSYNPREPRERRKKEKEEHDLMASSLPSFTTVSQGGSRSGLRQTHIPSTQGHTQTQIRRAPTEPIERQEKKTSPYFTRDGKYLGGSCPTVPCLLNCRLLLG